MRNIFIEDADLSASSINNKLNLISKVTKKYILLFVACLISVSCKGQENQNNVVEAPKGTCKVDKEFDENGNLIR